MQYELIHRHTTLEEDTDDYYRDDYYMDDEDDYMNANTIGILEMLTSNLTSIFENWKLFFNTPSIKKSDEKW